MLRQKQIPSSRRAIHIIFAISIVAFLWTVFYLMQSWRHDQFHNINIPWDDNLAKYPIQVEDEDTNTEAVGAISECGLRYRIFILHATNWNLTREVLAAFSEAGSDMVLIDVSFAEETRAHRVYLREQNITALYPHVPLSLAAGMEYIRRISMEWKLDYFLYSHNDAHYLRPLIQEANTAVCRYQLSNPMWGFLQFHYDVFCAYSLKAFRKTGMWDPYVPNYKADWDYYYRMRAAGFEVLQCDDATIGAAVEHGLSMTKKSLDKLSYEQKYGWWLTDEVGRFIYFQTKWNSPNAPSLLNSESYRLPFGGQSPELKLRFWIWLEYSYNQFRETPKIVVNSTPFIDLWLSCYIIYNQSPWWVPVLILLPYAYLLAKWLHGLYRERTNKQYD